MNKARLVPVFFPGRDDDFDKQVERLRGLLDDVATIEAPAPLGGALPDADGVVFPQMLGDAYRMVEAIRAIPYPRLIITSEFGTMSMWDWEISSYLRTEGIETIAPYNLDQAKKICRALSARAELRQSKFVVFQDNPGEGFQAPIFKRFYWWEDECSQRMLDKFGVTIERRSFREMGAAAKALPDSAAEAVWEAWKDRLSLEHMPDRSRLSALKVYLVLKRALDEDSSIRGMGINCLNESHFSDTTPCLAWNMLYQEEALTWGCEADTVSMLTQHVLHSSLGTPIMMTNLYPFLMGQAALKHERIPNFPDIPEPQNHILAAHCGYLGVLPQPFATSWTLRRKVLAIVDENATAIDARLPEGAMTLAKLEPDLSTLSVLEGSIEGYAQHPGSDCVNGAVLKIKDGHRLMRNLSSHHYLLMTGHNLADMHLIARVFGLDIEEI